MTRQRRRAPSPPSPARRGPPEPNDPRRLFWPAVVAGLLLAGGGIAWRAAQRSSQPAITREDRDVLLVTIDTLRADAVGRAGGRAATPNLDRLAASGIRFDAAHAHSVVTLPSHASILTGLYPFAHGIRDNAGYRLQPGVATLASRLQARGYATGGFVGAFPLDARFGLGAGFDVYDDRYASGGRATELAMPERRADAVVSAALDWIGRQRGRWFAWVHVYDPHAPYRPPAPFDRDYASDPYAGEVAYVDHALGPLLDAVRQRPRPVLVIVTADHGEALGGHGEATHGLFAYEETLRVPLIVTATDAGGRSPLIDSLPARHVDVLPTVLDSLGFPADRALAGRSLLDTEARRREELPSYFEALTASLNRGWAPLAGVILGNEKYIRLPIPELYDLAADARETRNLLPARSARGAALDALLGRLVGAASTAAGPFATAPRPESAETRQRLASLGYLSGGRPATSGRWTAEDDPKRLIALDQAIQRGIEQYQRGSADEARSTFEAVMRERPTMATPYLHLAWTLWEAGDAARAISTLRAAVAAGAATTEVRTQLGIYLAEASQPGEAVALLREATAADPSDLDAWNGLAIALSGSGRPGEALDVLRSVAAAHPTDPTTVENIGTLLLRGGDLPAARDAFNRTLALDADRPIALNGLGVVELREGRRDAAIAAWRRAVALDARQIDALYNLGVALLHAGDRVGARTYLEQFAASAPPALYAADLRRVRAWLASRR